MPAVSFHNVWISEKYQIISQKSREASLQDLNPISPKNVMHGSILKLKGLLRQMLSNYLTSMASHRLVCNHM